MTLFEYSLGDLYIELLLLPCNKYMKFIIIAKVTFFKTIGCS